MTSKSQRTFITKVNIDGTNGPLNHLLCMFFIFGIYAPPMDSIVSGECQTDSDMALGACGLCGVKHGASSGNWRRSQDFSSHGFILGRRLTRQASKHPGNSISRFQGDKIHPKDAEGSDRVFLAFGTPQKPPSPHYAPGTKCELISPIIILINARTITACQKEG